MSSTAIILALGIVMALLMMAWGLSGVFTGRVLTKSYGTVEGQRRYCRFVRRDEEPVWFWTLCCIYTGVGIAMMVVLLLILRTPAVAG